MAITTLSKLLEIFEETSGALSIQTMASELEIRPAQVESMVDFWINKGRIRVSTNPSECGSCSAQGDCSFIFEIPKTFELVTGQDHQFDPDSHIICTHK